MRYILKDLFTMRRGRTANITVWDGFHGEVKIIKNRIYKWLVEIVDVSMCYPQQVPFHPGDRIWIYRKELFRDDRNYKYKNKRNWQVYDDDLPF